MSPSSRDSAARDFLKLNKGQLHHFLKILDERRVFEKVVSGDFKDMHIVSKIAREIQDACLIPELADADNILLLCTEMVKAPNIQSIISELKKQGLSEKELLRFNPIFKRIQGKVGKLEKVPPPRPHEVPLEEVGTDKMFAFTYSKEYWDKLDSLFYRTIGHVEDAFKTNKIVNLVVVGIGVLFSAYGVIYSAYNGLDLFSTAFGTLGVGTFMVIFFFSPQKKIQKNVGDLIQAQLMYRTYCHQEEAILDWIRDNRAAITLEELEKTNIHLENVTKTIVEIIENLIGKE